MRYYIAFLLSVLAAAQANAATQWCNGRIKHAFVAADGRLVIMPEFRGDWMTVCNLSGTLGGVSSDTCKSWHATALTAVATRLQTTIMYHEAPACPTIPANDLSPTPNYILISNE